MVQRMKWASLHLGNLPPTPPIILENIFLLPGRFGGVVMFLFNLVIFLWSSICSSVQGATGILLVKIPATTYQTVSKLKQMSFLPLLLYHVFPLCLLSVVFSGRLETIFRICQDMRMQQRLYIITFIRSSCFCLWGRKLKLLREILDSIFFFIHTFLIKIKGTKESNVYNVVRWYNLTYRKGRQRRFRICIKRCSGGITSRGIVSLPFSRHDLEFT
jgi:hypothetical protein